MKKDNVNNSFNIHRLYFIQIMSLNQKLIKHTTRITDQKPRGKDHHKNRSIRDIDIQSYFKTLK